MKRPVLLAALLALCGGCLSDKASHQNGLIFYYSAPATVGVGYGETEDLPRGCWYLRSVYQSSPAFWGDGTNVTHTLTIWDTTCMPDSASTNSVDCASAEVEPQRDP